MIAKLCVQNNAELVGICGGRGGGTGSGIVYGELAELAGSDEKSGGSIEI
jgi:hypothetical protein